MASALMIFCMMLAAYLIKRMPEYWVAIFLGVVVIGAVLGEIFPGLRRWLQLDE